MAKFLVTLLYDASENVEVQADDAASAEQMAYENARASLCHHCANHLDLGDASKAIVYDSAGNEVTP